jgi:hypothetical protein
MRLLGCLALVGAAMGTAAAQESVADPAASARTRWEQKAVQKWQPASGSQAAAEPSDRRAAAQWQPVRRPQPVRLASAEGIPTPAPGPIEPSPTLAPTPARIQAAEEVPPPIAEPFPGEVEQEGENWSPPPLTYEDGVRFGGDGCGQFGDDCGDCDCEDGSRCGHRHNDCDYMRALARNTYFFAGIQGYKGPMDLGRNGNFGFHEGLNFGAALGDPWNCGYQLGLEMTHSNFSGSQAAGQETNDGSTRDQIFFTGGVFRRAMNGGLQGGATFDFLHDNYYDRTELSQIRSESSLVFGIHEFGYWGAYSLNDRQIRISADTQNLQLDVFRGNDMYNLFYRRRFSGGGEGRIWVGATGRAEGIIGADATVPMGTSWALENSFLYMVPKHGVSGGGQQEESWSVSLQLVWYPGRTASRVLQNPYHPLFNVADNSTFLVRRAGDSLLP